LAHINIRREVNPKRSRSEHGILKKGKRGTNRCFQGVFSYFLDGMKIYLISRSEFLSHNLPMKNEYKINKTKLRKMHPKMHH